MKKKPNLNAEKFLSSAPIVVTIGGVALTAAPRKFATGSLGYFASGKVPHLIDGEVVQIQVSANLPICGTKPGEAAE